MENYLESKKNARIAGLLFLLWIISGFYDMLFVSSKIFVSGDMVASAQNILKYEFLFRTSIFSGLITNTLWIFLAWVFYQLFKSASEKYANLLVIFVVVQIPIVFVKAGLSIAALLALKGKILKSFELVHRQDLAMTLLKINDYCVLALEFFWGLWLFPLSILVYQSAFIPRLIGTWLFLNGIVYLLLSFVSIVFPEYKDTVFTLGMPVMFGELVLVLWLLIKGVSLKKEATDNLGEE